MQPQRMSPMHASRYTCFIALAFIAAAVVHPTFADTQTLPNLKAGDPAPQLKVEKFIKGEPIAQFEPGHIYVLEFWSTFCGPCIQSIPELSRIQRKFSDKGVTVCGVDI